MVVTGPSPTIAYAASPRATTRSESGEQRKQVGSIIWVTYTEERSAAIMLVTEDRQWRSTRGTTNQN